MKKIGEFNDKKRGESNFKEFEELLEIIGKSKEEKEQEIISIRFSITDTPQNDI